MAITDNAIFAVSVQRSRSGIATVDLHEEVISPAFALATGARSLHIRLQINCIARQTRLMALDLYAGANLSGDHVSRPAEMDWATPQPDTYVADALHAACDADYRSPFASVAAAASPDSPAKSSAVEPPVASHTLGSTAQVGAFSALAGAQSAWSAIKRAFPDETLGLSLSAQPITQGGRRYVRAVIKGFTLPGQARAFCAKLQKARFNCLPVGPPPR